MGPFVPEVLRSAPGSIPQSEEGYKAETPPYCSECYNTHARASDAQVKAAESAGKMPMTKQGTGKQCGKATVVVYYYEA
jgi:hypothetical protein